MTRALALGLLALPALAAADEGKRWTLEAEIGPTWNLGNSARIPGDNADRFDLRDLLGKNARFTTRWTLTHRLAGGPELRLLAAPLEFSGTGRLGSPTRFEGATFAAGVDTRASYKFNSYRMTYRNRWRTGGTGDWRVGFTLKVRDAHIGLDQPGLSRRKKDLGVVPLLHLYGEQPLSDQLSLIVDFDGAWAPQGRAIDLGLKLAWRQSEALDWTAGVRVLEGGADNDKVYNFSSFAYLVFGARYRF